MTVYHSGGEEYAQAARAALAEIPAATHVVVLLFFDDGSARVTTALSHATGEGQADLPARGLVLALRAHAAEIEQYIAERERGAGKDRGEGSVGGGSRG
jgi:hypothetical protein